MKLIERIPSTEEWPRGKHKYLGKFWCDHCEREVVRPYHNGMTAKGCGCLKRRAGALNCNYRHGGCKSKLYRVWNAMIGRCNTDPDYTRHNIQVCDEWKTASAFLRWALANGYAEGLTLDRRDTLGHYTPENCRWTTMAVQVRNRTNTRWIEWNGKTQCLADWANELGFSQSRLHYRIETMDLEQALTPTHQPPFGTKLEVKE